MRGTVAKRLRKYAAELSTNNANPEAMPKRYWKPGTRRRIYQDLKKQHGR